jgi:hypothetical protein
MDSDRHEEGLESDLFVRGALNRRTAHVTAGERRLSVSLPYTPDFTRRLEIDQAPTETSGCIGCASGDWAFSSVKRLGRQIHVGTALGLLVSVNRQIQE